MSWAPFHRSCWNTWWKLSRLFWKVALALANLAEFSSKLPVGSLRFCCPCSRSKCCFLKRHLDVFCTLVWMENSHQGHFHQRLIGDLGKTGRSLRGSGPDEAASALSLPNLNLTCKLPEDGSDAPWLDDAVGLQLYLQGRHPPQEKTPTGHHWCAVLHSSFVSRTVLGVLSVSTNHPKKGTLDQKQRKSQTCCTSYNATTQARFC